MKRILILMALTLLKISPAYAVNLSDISGVGAIMGYSEICVEHLGMTITDTESDAVGKKYGAWLQKNLINQTQDLNELIQGVHLGMIAATTQSYANCDSVVAELIDLYQYLGYTGKAWIPVLEKYARK